MTEPDIDIVLECSFKKVTHSISFNPQAFKKAKKLVESDHVNRVKEYCVGGDRRCRAIDHRSRNSFN